MLAKIMITRKLVQCAKEKKLLVKEISKNPNTEIEGNLSESLVTYLCTTDKVKKLSVVLSFLEARLSEVTYYQKPMDL